MGNWSKLSMILGLSLARCVPALTLQLQEVGQSKEPSATVRLYDLEHLDSAVLEYAKHAAQHVFLDARIELHWVRCLDGSANQDICGQPLGPGEVALRILRRSKEATEATGRLTNGVAIRTDHGRAISGLVSIFYERTELIAGHVQSDCLELNVVVARGIVLGHFMAHEIGHILLPTSSHSVAGIMKERLEPNDWRQAIRGILLFTRKDSELMRRRLQEIEHATRGIPLRAQLSTRISNPTPRPSTERTSRSESFGRHRCVWRDDCAPGVNTIATGRVENRTGKREGDSVTRKVLAATLPSSGDLVK